MENFKLIGYGEKFKDSLSDILSRASVLSDLEWPEYEVLASYVQAYEAPAGTVIFNEGDAANYLCVLAEGDVDIVKNDIQNVPQVVTVVHRGKTLGEMALVDGEPRSASCRTRTKCIILLLTKENFQRIIKEKPGLAVKLLHGIAKLLSQRLRQTSGVLVDFLHTARSSESD